MRTAARLVFFATLVVVVSQVGSSQIFRRRIEEKRREQQAAAAQAQVTPRSATRCDAPLNLGFHIQTFSSGLRAAVWYPTESSESRFQYAIPLATALAEDAPVADCGLYPLVVYSHGLGGCGTISVFFTEALARAGYIVVAPDHKDSKCKVDQPFRGSFLQRGEEPFRRPEKWSPADYQNRADDIRRILDEMPRDPRFGRHIDRNHIGATGHSLGGYTIAGLAGGWSSWRDERIKAALLMSPYVAPFVSKGTLGSLNIPVMYQGGTLDFGITPLVKKAGGAYDATNPPKFFVEIKGAGHLAWSNRICNEYGSAPACIAESATARTINEYGIAFFERYLKGKTQPILERSNPELAEYRQSDRGRP
jgi:predicted dienelactone hydrolase